MSDKDKADDKVKKTKLNKELDKLRINGKLPDLINSRRTPKRNPNTTTSLAIGDTGPSTSTTDNKNPPQSIVSKKKEFYENIGFKEKVEIETDEFLTDDESEKEVLNENINSEINSDLDDSQQNLVLEDTIQAVIDNLENLVINDITKPADNSVNETERIQVEAKMTSLTESRQTELRSLAENWQGMTDLEMYRLKDEDLVFLLEQRIERITADIADTAKSTQATTNTALKATLTSRLEEAKTSRNRIILSRINASAPPNESQNTFKTLHKEVGKYGGKSKEDFKQWLHDETRSSQILKLSDNQLFEAVGWKLEGGPRETHRHFDELKKNEDKIPKWSEFLDILSDRYTNSMRVDQAREKLLSLKMSNLGNDIHKYNDEFDALLSVIGYIDMSDKEMLAAYKHGLNRNIHSELISKEAKDLATARKLAVSYCIREDTSYASNYAGKEINKSTTPNYNNNYRKPNTGNNYNNNNNNRSNDNRKYNSTYRPNNTRSFNQPRSNQPPRSYDNKSSNNNNNNYKNPNIECYQCKQKGHIKRNCPQLKSSNNITFQVNSLTNGSSSIPNSIVNIDGTPTRAFFDTGAECSIMSARTAERNKVKIVQTDIKIKTASDEIVEPIGQTEYLNVEIGNVSVKISFVVMEHENHPILLGMDWFNESRATIKPSDNHITFNSRRVNMINTSVVEYEDVAETDGDLYTDNGRPQQFSEFDETAESFGIAPSQINTVSVLTKEKLEEEDLLEWETVIVPAIKDRCSKGTHDIGKFNRGDMVIELTSQVPISRPIYRRSKAEMDEIEEQTQLLVEAGIVEESTSPYNNPIMAVRKKNGKIRIVNDFRGINAVMIPMIFPILLIGMILDFVAGNEFFSVLDMTSGFWQCPLEEESRKYTAFSTPKGHYQYTVCPQGVKIGPSYFNLCVSRAMRQCKGFALNYFDDIVIFSKNLKEHLKHITAVMKALKEYGFKISAEKSTWIAREVLLLGFIISGAKIRVNPEKISTIRNRPEPTNAKQVEVILGLFQFYSRFINHFAEKAKCLYNLTKKDVEWNWTDECKAAYKHFVTSITSEPAMHQPILGKEFIIYSDGSKVAIGGVLCQLINGIEHIIEYASRMLKGSELNYGISDIECLAVVFLVRKWHHYLYGVHFIVYTDHKALLNLMNIRDYHGRLGRQAMFLQEYNFTIK